MKKVYLTPSAFLLDQSPSPFSADKPRQMHCKCDTKQYGTNYKYDKVGWADCGLDWQKETCPTCGCFYFFFVDKGGIAYNNKHNLKET